jgi:hypothetical protein
MRDDQREDAHRLEGRGNGNRTDDGGRDQKLQTQKEPARGRGAGTLNQGFPLSRLCGGFVFDHYAPGHSGSRVHAVGLQSPGGFTQGAAKFDSFACPEDEAAVVHCVVEREDIGVSSIHTASRPPDTCRTSSQHCWD